MQVLITSDGLGHETKVRTENLDLARMISAVDVRIRPNELNTAVAVLCKPRIDVNAQLHVEDNEGNIKPVKCIILEDGTVLS